MTAGTLHALGGKDRPADAEVRGVPTTDGVALRVARWRGGTTRPVRGTVVLLHGRSEFVEKYYEVVGELLARDWAVVTFDWRGQGLSTRPLANPMKGHVEDFAEFSSDLLFVHEQLVLPDMPGPYVLLGHSMGGHCALRFLQEYPGRFDRMVLCAPMLGWEEPRSALMRAAAGVQVALGQGASYTFLGGDPDLDQLPAELTSDTERLARNQDYVRQFPALALGGPTWRWVQQATASIARIMRRDRLIRVKTPVLVASADKDTVVSPAKHRLLPFLNTSFTVDSLAGAMHEILQEKDEFRNRFWASFDRFTSERGQNPR